MADAKKPNFVSYFKAVEYLTKHRIESCRQGYYIDFSATAIKEANLPFKTGHMASFNSMISSNTDASK